MTTTQSTYIWTYCFKVGSVEHYYNAPNRKAANSQAKADGVPASAFIGRS